MLDDSSGHARRTDAAIGSPEAVPTGAIVQGLIAPLAKLAPRASRFVAAYFVIARRR